MVGMKPIRTIALAACAALTVGGLALPLAAQSANGLDALRQLTPGLWEVRERGSGEKTRMCIRSGQDLIQLRHKGASCSRHVVESGSNDVTVQYTCRGDGYGRTHIRRESAVLAQVESQGIVGGLPFEFAGEARRVGACR